MAKVGASPCHIQLSQVPIHPSSRALPLADVLIPHPGLVRHTAPVLITGQNVRGVPARHAAREPSGYPHADRLSHRGTRRTAFLGRGKAGLAPLTGPTARYLLAFGCLRRRPPGRARLGSILPDDCAGQARRQRLDRRGRRQLAGAFRRAGQGLAAWAAAVPAGRPPEADSGQRPPAGRLATHRDNRPAGPSYLVGSAYFLRPRFTATRRPPWPFRSPDGGGGPRPSPLWSCRSGRDRRGGGWLIWQWLRGGRPWPFGLLGATVQVGSGVIPTQQTVPRVGQLYAASDGNIKVPARRRGRLFERIAADRGELLVRCPRDPLRSARRFLKQ